MDLLVLEAAELRAGVKEFTEGPDAAVIKLIIITARIRREFIWVEISRDRGPLPSRTLHLRIRRRP